MLHALAPVPLGCLQQWGERVTGRKSAVGPGRCAAECSKRRGGREGMKVRLGGCDEGGE